jgi:hypothetical protein
MPTTSIMLMAISGSIVLGGVAVLVVLEHLARNIPEFDF